MWQRFHRMFNEFPQKELRLARLRELVPADAGDLFEYISHPEVHRFIAEEDVPVNRDAAQHEVEYWSGLFRLRQSIYWAIADKKTNKLIGTCGFNYWNRTHHKAEISYDLAFSYWRQGIMKEALQFVIAYGFDTMELNRISANVSPDNIASIALLERLGFRYEGLMRDYKVIRGEYDDAMVYSLLRREYDEYN